MGYPTIKQLPALVQFAGTLASVGYRLPLAIEIEGSTLRERMEIQIGVRWIDTVYHGLPLETLKPNLTAAKIPTRENRFVKKEIEPFLDGQKVQFVGEVNDSHDGKLSVEVYDEMRSRQAYRTTITCPASNPAQSRQAPLPARINGSSNDPFLCAPKTPWQPLTEPRLMRCKSA